MKSVLKIYFILLLHMLVFFLPPFVESLTFGGEVLPLVMRVLSLLILYYACFLVSGYIYQLGRTISWKFKGYQPTAIGLSHLLIQFQPKLKLRISILSNYNFDYGFLPYDTLSKIKSDEDHEKFYKDFIASEKLGLSFQFCFCLILILSEIILKKYIYLPHALTLPLVLYMYQSFEGETNHGAVSRIKNTSILDMSYYLARATIYLPGERKWIYKKFQQNIKNETIPKKFIFLTIETLKHIYMEKCLDQGIIIEESSSAKLKKEIESFSEWNVSFVCNAETFDLIKVMICYAIISNNEEEISFIRDCYIKMIENYSPSKAPDIYYWYLNLIRNKTIQNVDWKIKPEVIRRNSGLNKLKRYGEIENDIIQKIRQICPVVELNQNFIQSSNK